MKDKFGFNVIFAILAFPIGVALLKDTDFESLTFKRPALDIFYLVTFFTLSIFMLKKANKKTDK